jgi:site-specific recombinase XerD
MNTETLKILLPPEELDLLMVELKPNHTPISAHWVEFVEKYLRTGKSEDTVKSVRDAIRMFLRTTTLRSIEEFNSAKILEDTLYELKDHRGLTFTTMNTYLKNLKTYFLWMERMDYIPSNNLGKVSKGTEKRGTVRVCSLELIQRTRGHIIVKAQNEFERTRNLFFFELICFTGARPIELERLNLNAIRKTSGGLKLCIEGAKQKGANRYYRLPKRIEELWERYLQKRHAVNIRDDSLFSSNTQKSRWTRKGMTRFFTHLSRDLGEKVNPYAIRRFVATQLYEKGMPVDRIAGYMGHTRPDTTLKYIEESCVRTKEGTDVMGTILE